MGTRVLGEVKLSAGSQADSKLPAKLFQTAVLRIIIMTQTGAIAKSDWSTLLQ
jgi:hypothetical protein